jgi:hypothetical protein
MQTMFSFLTIDDSKKLQWVCQRKSHNATVLFFLPLRFLEEATRAMLQSS